MSDLPPTPPERPDADEYTKLEYPLLAFRAGLTERERPSPALYSERHELRRILSDVTRMRDENTELRSRLLDPLARVGGRIVDTDLSSIGGEWVESPAAVRVVAETPHPEEKT